MSSKTLYPPIVDSYMPAFAVDEKECKVYFSFSKYNVHVDLDHLWVHATVVKQDTNVSVVNLEDNYDLQRYRATGIILNLPIQKVEDADNLYYITITNDDLRTKAEGYQGWIPDWVYKIQLRLSEVAYNSQDAVGQAAWLKNNASQFSEWSTICTVKAINYIYFTLDVLDIRSDDKGKFNPSIVYTYPESTLIVSGRFFNKADDTSDLLYEGTEDIYKYNFTLYDDADHIIEKSGDIYANQYQDNKSYNYLFKTELVNQKEYKLEFKFETINHYEGGAFQKDEESVDYRIKFIVSYAYLDGIKCKILTAESEMPADLDLVQHDKFHTHKSKIDKDIDIVAPINSPSYAGDAIEQVADEPDISISDLLEENKLSTVYEDEEEGRIGLKIYDKDNPLFSGNLCIRRADSKDNFKTWTDIKIIPIKMRYVNDLPVIYDYTIESGVIYKYGVQEIKKDGLRTTLEESEPVMRNFNYSYLLGKNNKQLKLKFNNDMGSFKIQLQESKVDPIGATYPVVTRNAATYYKTFPVNGLISFLMDEQSTFCKKADLYTREEIRDFYESYNSKNNITQYDFIYEKDFRQAVLDFLHDGEIKLFKSPTEGNIIVRLTDINCTPNQTVDRLIYSFTSTAQEMADNTLENYLKYGFYNPGQYETDLSILETKLGQLSMTFSGGDNIFAKIVDKYNSKINTIGGLKLTVKRVRKALNKPVALMLDTKGPEIRTGKLKSGNEKVTIKEGQDFTFIYKDIADWYSPIKDDIEDEQTEEDI